MNQANRYRAATPKISVWGNENSPVHFRLASSVKSDGANDTEIVNVASQARNVYFGFQRTNEAAGAILLIGGWWNPVAWGVSALKFWRASQWKRGKDYIGGSEGSYKWLIGAYRYETTTYQSYERVNCNGDIMYRVPSLQEPCNEWRLVTRSYTRLVQEPSDGFIARGSQVGSKTSTWNPTQVEALGVNHMEMGTHPRTEQILRQAWNGGYGVVSNNPFEISIR